MITFEENEEFILEQMLEDSDFLTEFLNLLTNNFIKILKIL